MKYMVIQGPKKAAELILEIDKNIDSDNYDPKKVKEDNEKTYHEFIAKTNKLDKDEILALAGSLQALCNISNAMFKSVIIEIDRRYRINSLYQGTLE